MNIILYLSVCAVIFGSSVCQAAKAQYDFIHVVCQTDGVNFTEKVHKQVTINNVRGETYGELSLWENSFSKVKNIELKVIDQNGKQLYKVKKGDFHKFVGYDGMSLYNDDITYYYKAEAPKYPYTVEYSYEKEYSSLFFWNASVMQFHIPVEHYRYELIAPPDFSFRYKLYNITCNPVITGENLISTVWELSNIPAIPIVDYLPDKYDPRGYIRFAAENISLNNTHLNSATWQGVGQWSYELSHDKYFIDPDVYPATSLDDIKAIYNKVISSTRYVSIQIGIGGWQPYDAETVAERGFGDCKDLTTLLISRLRSAGVEAYPILLMTRDEGTTDSTFPSPSFNHVITMAVFNRDTIWMDPTCSTCPFLTLRSDDENVLVLVIKDNDSRLISSPIVTAEQNKVVRTTLMNLTADYVCDFEAVLTGTGDFSRRFRSVFEGLTTDEARQRLDYLFPQLGYNFTIKDFKNNTTSDFYQPFQLEARGRMIKNIDRIGNKLYLRPFLFHALTEREKLDLADRTLPISNWIPHVITDTVIISTDSSLVIDSIVVPEAINLTSPIGSLHVTFQQNGNEIIASMEKTYAQYEIMPEDFDTFRGMIDSLKTLSNKYIKIYIH